MFSRHPAVSDARPTDPTRPGRRYAGEAVALLKALGHAPPFRLLLMSDDGDVIADAATLGPTVAAVAAPGAADQISSHCRRPGADALLRPARPNVTCPEPPARTPPGKPQGTTRYSGDWHRGPRELARIYASLELAARCDAVVHNYESSFVQSLYRDACARRGGNCQLSFSFGNRHAPTDERADALIGRACAAPPSHETVRRKYGDAARACAPASPRLPGPRHWSDAADAFFSGLEREAAAGGA